MCKPHRLDGVKGQAKTNMREQGRRQDFGSGG